jgi:hypothetical protein
MFITFSILFHCADFYTHGLPKKASTKRFRNAGCNTLLLLLKEDLQEGNIYVR